MIYVRFESSIHKSFVKTTINTKLMILPPSQNDRPNSMGVFLFQNACLTNYNIIHIYINVLRD